mmetsp:Transcript_20185/g.27733  ORF Transcript_20185/g.27733 Transcript_20185/m.27733 type:complete len:540 (+) Transcript_20185:78-1697(+)
MKQTVKFSPMTRIGNWQEELALEEAKLENFKKKTNDGSGNWKKLQAKLSQCNEIVPHTYSPDGVIRFGDYVILQHDSSGAALSCDPFEEVMIGQEKYMVSGACDEVLKPKARNTFRITRPPPSLCAFNDDQSDTVLHIGQPFLLTCNEALLVTADSNILSPMLYLCSTKKNERTSTKRTNHQMAYISPNNDADAVWTVVIPSRGRTNGPERLLAMGAPVTNDLALQITHRQTNMYLTCDAGSKMITEFGVELECFADRSSANGKLGLMVSEFKGLSTSQTLTKPDAPVFSWHFVTGKSTSDNISERQLPPPATPEVILQEVQDFVRSRGIDGFWCLRDHLNQAARKMFRVGKLDREDLKAMLVDFGVKIRPKYIDILLDNMNDGNSKTGLVHVDSFLDFLRGRLSPSRYDLLKTVFNRLISVSQLSSSSLVSADAIRDNFRGDDHPLVVFGSYSTAEALKHMLTFFELVKVGRDREEKKEREGFNSTGGSTGRVVTGGAVGVGMERFVDYYADLSAAVDDDDYFMGMVGSNWAPLFEQE